VQRFAFGPAKPLWQDGLHFTAMRGFCEPLLTRAYFLLLMELDAGRTRRRLQAS
jgi:hypothetical protein